MTLKRITVKPSPAERRHWEHRDDRKPVEAVLAPQNRAQRRAAARQNPKGRSDA